VSSSKSYKIAVIPGDGTGPEVVHEGLKIIKALAAAQSIKYELIHYALGGECYKKTGVITTLQVASAKGRSCLFIIRFPAGCAPSLWHSDGKN
jgi:isocitrate/isopropylmalate dehydrogenase